MNNLSTGFSEFYNAPAAGFRTGSDAFSSKMALGSKHAAHGVFNTLQGLSGTLSSGFASISSDRQFMRARSVIQHTDRPSTAYDGFMSGASNFGDSVVSGLSGMVDAPLKGAQHGTVGFFKGIGVGMVGLVAKPVRNDAFL